MANERATKKDDADVIVGYKGFNADWTCRGMQYEVGKTYTYYGEVRICSSGFHWCEYPLDVFSYYPPTGRIAVIEADYVSDKREVDSKRASRSITIKAALSIAALVSASIKYTTRNADPVKTKHANGYQSAASATGYQSAASATGYRSAASATGDWSAASAGDGGIVVLAWHDGARKRMTVGYVGENGIEAGVSYRCDDAGNLVPT